MPYTAPILLRPPRQPTGHHQIIRRNNRILGHILQEIRARVRVRHLAILLVGRAPLVGSGELAGAVAAAVQRVAHFVQHHGKAAPVVVALALLVEEHDVVVGVVGEVGDVVGQQQHAFDVRAGTDGDAAEELDEVPEGVGAVFVAAEDLCW